MSGPRDPDAVLDELGARLRAGFARADHAPWWRRLALRRSWRPLVLGLVLAAFASTAVATRDVLNGPAIPDLPAQLRAPAREPDSSTRLIYVAAGELDGVAWRLSAASCDYGGARVVSAFLEVASGGGGSARCAAAARRVQSYYDPAADRTWVFGVLPATVARAEVRAGRARVVAATTDLDEHGATAAGLSGGMRAFVTAVPGAVTTYSVAALDRDGSLVLSCNTGSCR
jgi:hypothetical protein